MPLTIAICVVLAIVATSYWQTIRAYPNGASSYLVASDNLGCTAGLVAGAALLIDYTLTVAVSVSAAVAAITSVMPELFPERVLMAVGIVAVLMLGNLRGVRESGTIFMAPTYLYIVAILAMVGIGRRAGRRPAPLPDYTPPTEWLTAEAGGEALGIFLILRAFSSGAAALTGVEAISDGVPAFKPPEWRNARITLVWAAAIFAALFLGISFMASTIGIIPDPTEEQTVLSQIARLLVGDGVFFVLIQVATVLVLALAANTAFADFPRLIVVPGARQLHAAPVRVPRRAAGVHDRHRRPVRPGGAPARRLRRQRHRADPALHARRLPRLHAVAVEHGRALVAAARAGLAARPR